MSGPGRRDLEPLRSVLRRRERVAEQTIACYFDKPSGFDFAAGQTIDVTLVDTPEIDAEGNTRTFSIASAPHEAELVIVTRIRPSAFKWVLSTMPLGAAVHIDGPMGEFTLSDRDANTAIFVAGGIGITPFRSMILDAQARAAHRELWLFYANRRPEDAAFLDEFRALAMVMPTFHFVATFTAPLAVGLPLDEHGRVDLAMIRRRRPDLSSATCYVAGPPGMVVAVHSLLIAAGVRRDYVRGEEFTGY